MALYLILGLGLVLRLLSLNQSLWLDEAILANAVSRLSLTDLITQYMPTDFNPPLFYLFEWFWGRWFGFSEIALRFPSVIFGMVTVYLVYRLGGKLPALLLATSGLSIYYSQEARMYSLAALAVKLAFFATYATTSAFVMNYFSPPLLTQNGLSGRAGDLLDC